MRKLHRHIFVAFLALLALCALLMGGLSRLLWSGEGRAERMIGAGADLLLEGLPEGDALEPALRARAERLGLEASLWDAQGKLIARTGAPLAGPEADGDDFTWVQDRARVAVRVHRPDGRWLAIAVPHDDHGPLVLPWLVILLFALAVGTYPIARKITRRLETLRAGVERLGAGDLAARVPVQGRDEVAQLARAFNASAERIERLVGQQKRVLASASHEFRAPLTRLRMGLELLGEGEEMSRARRAELLERGARDIQELDALVADVLLAARLERPDAAHRFAELDLGELVSEVTADAGVAAEVTPVHGAGDATMLRRMLRNLVDNARRYSGGEGVELRLERGDGGALIAVLDRGPGVPEAERERIFEPFYRPQGHSEGRDGGVGLGLSLVRHVAEHHGGSVRCLARAGGGSRFEVMLPGFA